MRIAKSFIGASCIFFTTLVGTSAFGSWSQEWTGNYPLEAPGSFTAIEFIIMPGSPGVTFSEPSGISAFAGSSQVIWNSPIPYAGYSLLTGPMADNAVMTTWFSSPASTGFTLGFVLSDGGKVSEKLEFQWTGGHWDSVYGSLLTNNTGGFGPVTSVGANNIVPSSLTPVPATLFLLGPALLGVLVRVHRRDTENAERAKIQ